MSDAKVQWYAKIGPWQSARLESRGEVLKLVVERFGNDAHVLGTVRLVRVTIRRRSPEAKAALAALGKAALIWDSARAGSPAQEAWRENVMVAMRAHARAVKP